MKYPQIIITLAAAMITQHASAQFSSIYAFATTDEGSLNQYTSLTTGSLIASNLVTNTNQFRVNHLATDAARTRVIYGVENIATGALTDVRAAYIAGPAAGQNSSILNGNDISFIGNSNGGGSFFNGAYYLYDDIGPNQGIVRMTFGTGAFAGISSISMPWGINTAGGDLGDIAIDGAGQMFLFNEARDLYSFDLNNSSPSQQLSFIGNYSASVGGTGTRQMFIDDLGRIMINAADTGDWRSLDPLNPGSSTLIPGIDITVGTNTFSDLSSGGRPVGVVIPEPSTALLGGLGLLALFRRKRVA